MGMVKIITPGCQEFHEPVMQLVKVSSRGLVGDDLQQLIKRASVKFADEIRRMNLGPGEVPVHVIALGATERFGPNRNGDGFRREICRQFHPTFTKYARWYRHHKNRDPSKSYGVVKASAYNDEMDRVELLVALNSTKEAASRNGGLVADEELEKLANGNSPATSMSCWVSADVCSGCNNRARTRAEYCDDAICKYGGLKHNMSKVFEDGHVLHADNPDPRFFDISHVLRPADRIAYALGKAAQYEPLLKAAANRPMCGAEWAERLGVTAPLWLRTADGPWNDQQLVGQLKIANRLIELEATAHEQIDALDKSFAPEVQPLVPDLPQVGPGREKLAHVLSALADQQCMLPLTEFLSLISGRAVADVAVKTAAVAARLSGVFARLAEEPNLEQLLRANPYRVESNGALPPMRLRRWAAKYAGSWSLSRDHVIERLQRAVLRSAKMPAGRPLTKSASTATDELAREYGLYQLALLEKLASSGDSSLAERLVVRCDMYDTNRS